MFFTLIGVVLRSGRSAQLFKEGDSEVAPVTFSYDHKPVLSENHIRTYW
jgi:hypothetical protein